MASYRYRAEDRYSADAAVVRVDRFPTSERRLHRMHTDFAKLRRAAQAAVAPGATLDTIAELRRVLEEIS